jgi:hypothetical protein
VGIKRNKFFRGEAGSAENVEFHAKINEDVLKGHILAFFPDGLFGQVRRARAATNQVIGVSLAKEKQGRRVKIVQEGLCSVRMDSIPNVGDNGKPVYLSQNTNGVASLTAPTASGCNVIKIGYLYGADGINIIPDVVLNFQFIVYLG